MKKYFVKTILVIAALLIGAVATSQTSTAAAPWCPPLCPVAAGK
jgi:hypothetical protein